MVSIEESIPTKSNSFLAGLDIFYTQFNDVNFYIEDEEQENFYFEIFRKLFPDINLNKIFPLRGKDNVIKKAKKHNGDKKKVFLVDKDFDDLLGKSKAQPNLFYLEKYSIENYLINIDCFIEYVIEEKPKIKRKLVSKKLKFDEFKKEACNFFYELTLLHILVQSKDIRIQNASNPPEKYLQFGPNITLKLTEILKYKSDIQVELHKKDKRLNVDSQLRKIKQKFGFKCGTDLFEHIPGKYLIKFYKCKTEHLFNLPSREIHSFNFRIAKLNTFENLDFLKIAVNNYLQ